MQNFQKHVLIALLVFSLTFLGSGCQQSPYQDLKGYWAVSSTLYTEGTNVLNVDRNFNFEYYLDGFGSFSHPAMVRNDSIFRMVGGEEELVWLLSREGDAFTLSNVMDESRLTRITQEEYYTLMEDIPLAANGTSTEPSNQVGPNDAGLNIKPLEERYPGFIPYSDN